MALSGASTEVVTAGVSAHAAVGQNEASETSAELACLQLLSPEPNRGVAFFWRDFAEEDSFAFVFEGDANGADVDCDPFR